MKHFEGPLNGETLSDTIRKCSSMEGYRSAVVFESVSRMTEFFETLKTALRDEFICEMFTPTIQGIEEAVYILTNKVRSGFLEIMTKRYFERVISAQYFRANYDTILFDTDGPDSLTAPNPALDDFFASLTVVDKR